MSRVSSLAFCHAMRSSNCSIFNVVLLSTFSFLLCTFNLLKARQNVLSVLFHNPLFFATHQIDVELRNPNGLKFLQFFNVLFDGSQNTETVDNVLSDKSQMIGVFVRVMAI